MLTLRLPSRLHPTAHWALSPNFFTDFFIFISSKQISKASNCSWQLINAPFCILKGHKPKSLLCWDDFKRFDEALKCRYTVWVLVLLSNENLQRPSIVSSPSRSHRWAQAPHPWTHPWVTGMKGGVMLIILVSGETPPALHTLRVSGAHFKYRQLTSPSREKPLNYFV